MTTLDRPLEPEIPLSEGGKGEQFSDILQTYISRRSLLAGGAAASALVLSSQIAGEPPAAGAQALNRLNFAPIPGTTDDELHVAAGHRADVLVRWGDPIVVGSPPFDPANQTPEAQAMQFGYNNDFIGYMPLPPGSGNPNRGLLCVNNEYTNPELMFAGYSAANPTKQQVDIELAAHGVSIVEIARGSDRRWGIVQDSPYNRRLTATTPTVITGQAAGSEWLRTTDDPTGTRVLGTLNNCSAGKTPWGTILTCEENFNQYFANLNGLPGAAPQKGSHTRYGLTPGASERKWERFYPRFDIAREPNEPNRYGWVVEFDPYDPNFVPRKRTSMGRVKHEAATVAVSANNRVAFYSGDDERFDYAYKFVSAKSFNPSDRAANLSLLNEGTLYVAKFNNDGTGVWLPLIHGMPGLTAENNFYTQADILVHTRLAGDAVGATKMDRAEDIEPNPVNGKIYMMLTNNNLRGTAGRAGTDAANPRVDNRNGHVIEITETNNDYASTTFTWNVFMLCGDPSDPTTYFAGFPKERVSGIAAPDNCFFDVTGNLWITSDGMPSTALAVNDGLFAVPVAGPERGYLRRFFSVVAGAECASADFNSDSTTVFVSIQHPGEGGTVDKPVSTWPDRSTNYPRPSVVAISSIEGSQIGTSGASAGPLSGAQQPSNPSTSGAMNDIIRRIFG